VAGVGLLELEVNATAQQQSSPQQPSQQAILSPFIEEDRWNGQEATWYIDACQ
jgi:hypothetical protein